MARGFFNKLLGRTTPPPPEVQTAGVELERLGRERPSLASIVALWIELLPVLFEDSNLELSLALFSDLAAKKRAGGIPLLRGERLTFDPRALRQRWTAVTAILDRHTPAPQASRLAPLFEGAQPTLEACLDDILAGAPERLHASLAAACVNPDQAATALRLLFLPLLARVRSRFADDVRGVSWEHGHCPTCGRWPALAEFRGLDQIRYLRCGLCGDDWEFPRLRCPYCDNRDHRALGYFQFEGDASAHRAATCDACHGYVKSVSTLRPLTLPQLLVAEVATLPLDLAATERGFQVLA